MSSGGQEFGRRQNGEMPRDHEKQNKQVKSIVRKVGLNKDQQRKLHSEIHGQGLSYQEILQIAKDIKD